ncbi:NAD(+) diphosphatase [Oricola cellulosilytica]|uniref:NAD(+) diphosphatase n=1 Tax=Oricola cellulosilytica TaxID=1429082 RepID=A0A4R0PI98_9HYPH|nr:NAD(+) diphosphatase [Oricola cellulosilytica]TCD16454.1 NAD(+) diphosphatase [Oricola cellulosilytica]
MTTRLSGAPHPDPSSETGFARNRLQRRSEKRSANSTRDALKHDHARMYLLTEGRVLLKHDEEVFDPLFATSEIHDLDVDLGQSVLLGFEADETPVLAAFSGIDTNSLPHYLKAIDFRSVYVQELLPPDKLGALAQAASLVSWNRSHRFCARCGQESEIADGGYKRSCPSCNAQHFPRTDPVVIMLAVTPENDACLLGRSAHFPEKMYSCLAGFVEPGETIESAVRRETEEESGIRVGKVAYYASQPWPFPHTLMIGCHAVAENTDIRTDDELEDCRWFSREEVRLILDREHPEGFWSPPNGAIASHLVRAWMNEGG